MNKARRKLEMRRASAMLSRVTTPADKDSHYKRGAQANFHIKIIEHPITNSLNGHSLVQLEKKTITSTWHVDGSAQNAVCIA